jgi:hypothetical protein
VRIKKATLPTVRSRELGNGLRAAMAATGLGVRELTHQLGWTHPYLSHLLSGVRYARETDLLSVLLACNVHRAERERLLRLAAELHRQGWLQQYDTDLPEAPRTLVDHERKAREVSDVQLLVLPKLLQTQAYAHAVLGARKDTEARIQARVARQEIFDQDPRPRMTFFLHESALRATAGDRETMSGQLHHLLKMSVRPSLELRVIPSALGVHAGHAGSFTLMEFAKHEPVVYLESEVSAVFLEQQHQIAAYRRILDSLTKAALGQGESKRFIATLATK